MIQHSPALNDGPDVYELASNLCAAISNGIESASEAIFEYTDAAGRTDPDLGVALRDELSCLSDQVQGLTKVFDASTGGADADDDSFVGGADVDDEVEGASLAVAVGRRVWKPDYRLKNDYDAMLERAREKAAAPPTPEEADALGRAEEDGFLTAGGATGATLCDRWTVRCLDAGRPSIEVVTLNRIDGVLTAYVGFTPDPGLLFDEAKAAESEALGARVSDLFRAAAGGVHKGRHFLLSHHLPVEGAVAIAARLVEIVAEVEQGDHPGAPSTA